MPVEVRGTPAGYLDCPHCGARMVVDAPTWGVGLACLVERCFHGDRSYFVGWEERPEDRAVVPVFCFD